MEEEGPKEDSKVSEGKLMGSEHLERDANESEMEATKKEKPEGEQEEEMRESIVLADQIRGPEGLDDEIDPVEKKGELETGVAHWKRGRCGRMCRGTCPLDVVS